MQRSQQTPSVQRSQQTPSAQRSPHRPGLMPWTARIEARFMELATSPSDINEHLGTLAGLSRVCHRVLELGVRGVVSSWAFAYGLSLSAPSAASSTRTLLMNDLEQVDISELATPCSSIGISIQAQWKNCLDLDLDPAAPFDLVFIDTWHVYGQLKRELAKFAPHTRHFIAMHDTTIDGTHGESLRCGLSREEIAKQSADTGIPVREIKAGLWRAVVEFLQENQEWRLMGRWMNNNGMTVLQRKDSGLVPSFDFLPARLRPSPHVVTHSMFQAELRDAQTPKPPPPLSQLWRSGRAEGEGGWRSCRAEGEGGSAADASNGIAAFRAFLSRFPRPNWANHPSHETAYLEAVLVASDVNPDLGPVLANLSYMLPGVAVTLCHSARNEAHIREAAGVGMGISFPGLRLLRILPDDFSFEDYSVLLLTPSFWARFTAPRVLIFQADSCLLRNTVLDFASLRYVGAPWSFDAAPPNRLHVGNGGFSLRDPVLMRNVAAKSSLVAQYRGIGSEDLVFCRAMYNSSKRDNYLPRPEVAARFASETVVTPGCLGVHKPWAHHPPASIAPLFSAALAELGDDSVGDAEPKAKASVGDAEPKAKASLSPLRIHNFVVPHVEVRCVDGSPFQVLSDPEQKRLVGWVRLGMGPRGFYCGANVQVPLPPTQSPTPPAAEIIITWEKGGNPLQLTALWANNKWVTLFGSFEGTMSREVVRSLAAEPGLGYMRVVSESDEAERGCPAHAHATASQLRCPAHAPLGSKPSLDPTISNSTWRRIVQFTPPRVAEGSSQFSHLFDRPGARAPPAGPQVWMEMVGAYAERHPGWSGEFFFGTTTHSPLPLPVWRG